MAKKTLINIQSRFMITESLLQKRQNEDKQVPGARMYVSMCVTSVNTSGQAHLGKLRQYRLYYKLYPIIQCFPGGVSGKELACQCGRHKRCGLAPWVRKISWRRKWQPSPIILAWKIPWTEEPGRL